ncbi:MAG: hypothetical protein Q8L34_02915 [Candidatus Woesearchaeota archaeon]|nr:hypothetical protein [Candidatus Woesearchaeota archaeon]
MKGQVTGFVIIGIIILALGITVYTFRAEIFSKAFGSELEENIVVPAQAERAKLYVDTCIETVTTQGLNILGSQGGYISVPQSQQQTLINPFGKSLDLFGTGNGAVPFWFVETETGIQENQIPTKEEMQISLAQYIDDNLLACLNGFKPLQDQGYGFEESQPQSRVVINEQNVIVQTVYPFTIIKEDFTFTFNQFRKNIKSSMGKLYDEAVQIMEKESQEYFLEERALDMMAVYDTVPFSGIDTDCVPRTWLKTNVQKEAKKIFAANFPSLRIAGSSYKENENDPKSFLIDALAEGTETSVLFTYDEQWPLLMDVVGENEEILRGKPFTAENAASRFLLPLFCMNDNHFVYDMKFPMLISLQEGDSMFQYATLVVIDNNQPRENRVTPVNVNPQNEICEYPGKELTVIAAAYRADGSLQEIPDARIAYKCLDQVCDRGLTQADPRGAALTTTFPQCSDGIMSAEKEGYHRGETVVSTNTIEGEIIVYMEPITEVTVEVQVIDNQQQRVPYQTEQIIITLENVEKKYSTTLVYPDQKTVSLIPGEYIVTSRVIVTNAGGFDFPEQEIEICNEVPQKGVLGIAGLTTRQCVKQKIDATELDQIIGGGATTSWSVERNELATANKVTFYTVRGPTPRSLEDVSKVYEAVQQQNNEVNKPVLE